MPLFMRANQNAAADRRSNGQADGSGYLAGIVAADPAWRDGSR